MVSGEITKAVANIIEERLHVFIKELDKEIKEAELEKEGKGYYRFMSKAETLKRAKYLFEEIVVKGNLEEFKDEVV